MAAGTAFFAIASLVACLFFAQSHRRYQASRGQDGTVATKAAARVHAVDRSTPRVTFGGAVSDAATSPPSPPATPNNTYEEVLGHFFANTKTKRTRPPTFPSAFGLDCVVDVGTLQRQQATASAGSKAAVPMVYAGSADDSDSTAHGTLREAHTAIAFGLDCIDDDGLPQHAHHLVTDDMASTSAPAPEVYSEESSLDAPTAREANTFTIAKDCATVWQKSVKRANPLYGGQAQQDRAKHISTISTADSWANSSGFRGSAHGDGRIVTAVEYAGSEASGSRVCSRIEGVYSTCNSMCTDIENGTTYSLGTATEAQDYDNMDAASGSAKASTASFPCFSESDYSTCNSSSSKIVYDVASPDTGAATLIQGSRVNVAARGAHEGASSNMSKLMAGISGTPAFAEMPHTFFPKATRRRGSAA